MVSGLYAALAAVLLIVLALRVVAARRSEQIGIGDAGHPLLMRRIRAHANALENVPLALILLLMLELDGLPAPWLHGFGSVLLLARLWHAVGLSRTGGYSIGRFWGTFLTWSTMLVMSIVLIVRFFA